MSVSSIIDNLTGKIYDNLIPQGGSIPLQKGQLITADAAGTETAFPVGTNGFVLSCNTAEPLGLEYIQLPAGGINFTQEGQLLYAGAAPAFTDSLLNIGNAGQILGINAGIPAWINAGGSGTITALAPLTEYAVGNASNIAIDFTAKGDLVVGAGAQAGGNPVAGVILPVGANDYVLTANSATASGLEWKASGSGSSATIFRNSNDTTPLIITAPVSPNDTCIITTDQVFNDSASQIYNVGGAGVQTPTGGILIFAYTPAINITITNIVANIKAQGNGEFGAPINTSVALTSDAQGQNALSVSNIVPVSNTNTYNYTGFSNLPLTPELQAGTTYYFFHQAVLSGGDQFWNYINTTPVGDITITGISYPPPPAVSTFTLNPPVKFRITNDLTGNTSATCNSYSSQSFVASQDLQSWIAIGGTNAGVLFIP